VTDDQRHDDDAGPEDTASGPGAGATEAAGEGVTEGSAEAPDDAERESDEVTEPDAQPAEEPAQGAEPLDPEDQELLDEAVGDLVAEFRDRAARAEAELVNFRARVERDRQANRDAVVAEVLRAVIPAFDDLARAEAHGDIAEGSSLEMVVAKLRGGFEKFGFTQVGEKGEPFDPTRHEAIASFPGEVERETVLDVVEPGYLIGDRVVRPAKVAVQVPKS